MRRSWLVVGSCVLVLASCAGESDPPSADAGMSAPVTSHRACAADDVLAQQLSADPKLGLRMRAIEDDTLRFADRVALVSGNVVIIPTVVHVLYRTTTENISDAQIQTQIDVLNADFRRMNADQTTQWPQAADSLVEFRLMGVSRTPTTQTSFGTDDSIKFTAQGGRDVYQPANYLNMWVGNIGGGILGYAQFPGGAPSTDGVVVDYRYFGTIGTATAPFHLGRTATHEVGHYLNLRHIWGDSSTCGVDDFVSDTPDSNQPNFGCAPHQSCNNGGDMIENYMDYTDDSCMNLFTAGQNTRMQALFAAGGVRNSIANAPLTPVDFQNPPPPPPYQVIDTRAGLAAPLNTETAYGPYSAVGASAIKFEISGGTGDADLYVRFGATPTQSAYDCRPFTSGNVEICEFNPSQSGNYYVMIHAYAAYSGVTLTVSTAGGTPLEVCTDAIDNDGDGDVDCDDADCATSPACAVTPVTLLTADFTSGFAPFEDGGIDARRVTSATNCAAGACVELRDDTASSNIATTASLDVTPYSSVTIRFSFLTRHLANGERFLVEVWNGSSWTAAQVLVAGTTFVNDVRYAASVPITSAALLTSSARIRFRADGSSDKDLVFIDDVVVTGTP